MGEVTTPRLTSRFYTAQQRSGNSFDTRFLALNMMRAAKSDADWVRDYELAFMGLLISRGISGGDHEVARRAADGVWGLHQSGTETI